MFMYRIIHQLLLDLILFIINLCDISSKSCLLRVCTKCGVSTWLYIAIQFLMLNCTQFLFLFYKSWNNKYLYAVTQCNEINKWLHNFFPVLIMCRICGVSTWPGLPYSFWCWIATKDSFLFINRQTTNI